MRHFNPTIRQKRLSAFAFGAVLGLGLLSAGPAKAGLDACENFYVAADATCEWVPEQESCGTLCEPVAVQSNCAAQLYLECEGRCNASAELTCIETCEPTCVSDCVADGVPSNCMGLCMSDCQMDCTAACAEAEDEGACRSSCAHTCSEGCEAECKDGDSCEVMCTDACAGSCFGRANIDCQVECQGESFAECEVEVVDECQTVCAQEGALFCDGSYVSSGNLDDCVAAIESALDVKIEGWVEGECEDPEGAADVLCRIQGGLSCSVIDEPPSSWPGTVGFVGLGLFAMFGFRRKRR
jgi:MYXO-CTERM domain-containing protein